MARLNVIYRGEGTGLRLESNNGKNVLDITGSHAKNAPMGLYVADDDQVGHIDLKPHEVVMLIEACAHYLSRTLAPDK